MNDYQTHPDPSCYDMELRGSETVDDYISRARGFSSTAEWREYRDGSPETREAMRRNRNRDNDSADSDDSDRRRTLEFLKAGT